MARKPPPADFDRNLVNAAVERAVVPIVDRKAQMATNLVAGAGNIAASNGASLLTIHEAPINAGTRCGRSRQQGLRR